jgi:LacI family transcriptional regulator
MSTHAKVTIRDVARLAGVSIATVSAVINATAVVSPKRTLKVREAMTALDYHPDQVARSLKVGRTQVIGVVIPDITNAFYPEVIRGMEDAAREANYSVILCNSNEDPAQEQRHLSTLFSRRVDGVLIACSDASTAYESLGRKRFPIVFFDRLPVGLHCGAVGTDNPDAGYVATKYLLDLGHRRIALITGNLRHSTHQGRLDGFRCAMQDRHVAIHSEYLRDGDLSVASGYAAGSALVRMRQPPSAVIASNNKMLLGLMRAISESGFACPSQVSVIGFDDYVWTEHFTPRLTVIAQDAFGIGQRSMGTLLDKIRDPDGAEAPMQSILLKAELRIRESTAPPPDGQNL